MIPRTGIEPQAGKSFLVLFFKKEQFLFFEKKKQKTFICLELA